MNAKMPTTGSDGSEFLGSVDPGFPTCIPAKPRSIYGCSRSATKIPDGGCRVATHTFHFQESEVDEANLNSVQFLAAQCAKQIGEVAEPGEFPPPLFTLLVARTYMTEEKRQTLRAAVRQKLNAERFGGVPVILSDLDDSAVKMGLFRPGIVVLGLVSHILRAASQVKVDTDHAEVGPEPMVCEHGPIVA